MSAIRIKFLLGMLAGLALCGANPAFAADEGPTSGAVNGKTAPIRADFLDAAYLPGLERVVVVGHHGLVGLVEIVDGGARLTLIGGHPDADFSAIEKLSDSAALIGGSNGRLYRFDGETISEIAALSEYDEPILDIAAGPDSIWVVGARGLLARSNDGAKTFENIEISGVTLPTIEFPAAHAADWYLGVGNIDLDSIEFNATVNGEAAVSEEHYVLYPDEGFLQFQTDLDMDPPPTISLKFDPGPPFRAGDVSWNVVLLGDGTVTVAGEFGMVLQSTDNGETWVRRDTEIVPREPEPAYWMSGVQNGQQIWLAGAAGVSQVSNDGGVSWEENPKPGREGIFGITIGPKGRPLIAGAVGLIGTLENGKWSLADRTQLKLLSWLRTPVPMPDGSVLVMGGRAAAIRYKDGGFKRVPVTF